MFNEKKRIIIAIVLILISFFFILINISETHQKKNTSFRFFQPFYCFYNFFLNLEISCQEIKNGIFETKKISKENDFLKKEIFLLKRKTDKLKELEIENARLNSLFSFKKIPSYQYTFSKVIGRNPSFLSNILLIDKGIESNIKKNMIAITDNNIVGKIIEVFYGFSKLQLIVDSNCNIGAMLQNSNVCGIVQGKETFSQNLCILKYIPHHIEIQKNELVITSGLGKVFPKGLLIGKVINVKKQSGLFQDITIESFVDYNKLKEVIIIKNEK
ncbi:MAG: rod shape-determining protein MreC [bacterium]